MEAAGSIRRMSETVGDIDLLAATKHPKKLMDAFVNLPEVADVEAKGEAKTLVRLNSGFDADLRIVPEASWGAALLYFTGSRDHTLVLRNLALDKGYTLNEYGLYTHDKKRKLIAGKTEESVYRALGLQYIPPELREDRGEIAAAQKKKLPALIGYGDLQGDLQVQTDWTDGAHSIEEMAHAARDADLAYIAVTDHTKALAMTHGLDEKLLRKQMAAIAGLNKKLAGRPHILAGAEVNILKDGTLDINDSALAALDIVGASVHSHFNLPKKEQTERIIRAIENPQVDILYHPTGRLIGSRPAYEVDMKTIIAAAVRTGTVLEINAAPNRLDLKDTFIYEAVNAGCHFAIDSDAHEQNHFGFLPLGVGQARRGGVSKDMVINTMSLKRLLALLKKPKSKRF
jgi:DNA polymerase (family 10)